MKKGIGPRGLGASEHTTPCGYPLSSVAKNKKLKKVVGELHNASKMHKNQAETIDKHIDSMETDSPAKKRKGDPCWKGYEMVGMKKKGNRKVPNCVPTPAKMRKTIKGKGRTFRTTEEGAGMTAKGVSDYKKENPGSKLQTAVTGDVKPGSKSAKRRKSFCARSKGWTGERGKAARARWKC